MTTPSTSSRPYTSSGREADGRPTTSSRYPDPYDRDPQYTYSQDYSFDEEDEESEAEDVFAFGPPSTADSVASPASPIHRLISQPPPVYDPYGGNIIPTNVVAGPSTLHTRHPYPHPQSPTVETPPSTDSQTTGNPYALQRTPSSYQTSSARMHSGARSAVSSAISSREVHISLPRTQDRIEEEQAEDPQKSRPPSSVTSFPSLDSAGASMKMEFDFDGIDDEDSPYAEVRASVSNIDDPEMPCLTLRMWVVGFVLLAIVASANMFFNFRQPAPAIAPNVIVLAAYPFGKFLAYSLPITTYRFPRWMGGKEFSLNPGPWNIKEHACVYMMANVAAGAPYAINAVVVAELDYDQGPLGYWFATLLSLSTQLTGFALAGLCRRVLVQPASMIWPADLVTCTVLNTLHAEEDESRGGITRYRFFMYVITGSFFWFFLPGYLFTGLSVFSWICWIVPNNIPVNQLFGEANGMGLFPVTFDWSQITWISNPIMSPWWAGAQIFTGFVVLYGIILPCLYYTNTWHLAHFPMYSNSPYDRYGKVYDVTRVLNPDRSLNTTAYDEYSPLYLPGAYAITYLVAFTLSSAVLVHTVLYWGPALVNAVKNVKIEKDDIHAKLMRSYPEVPNWWYALLFVIMAALTAVTNEVWHTGLPLWGMALSIFIPVVYMLPSGFIYATAGQPIAVNLIAQVVPGALLPGKPIANMIFKGYTIQVLNETSAFLQDLKLGHYIKVPPRTSFIVQLTSTMFATFIQVGIKEWMFAVVPDICQPHQASSLTCPRRQVYFTASAIWGVIGPSRQFGKSSIYYPEVFATIIGVFLPIPLWYWQRKRPNSWNIYISMPVVLNSVQFTPPATGINYSSWILVCFIFQYWIRRRNFQWWSKFNYVSSAAMDIGTLLCIIFIFFAIQLPRNGSIQLKWWGNTVWQETADGKNLPLKSTPTEGF